MRILSKTKDYYDYIQKYGFDPSLVYDRKQYEITLESDISNIDIFKGHSLRKLNISLGYLFFCGEIFTYFDKFEIGKVKKYRRIKEIVNFDKNLFNYFKTYKPQINNKVIEAIPSNVPIAFIERHLLGYVKIDTNPNLGALEFYKECHAELAYQKIAQYLYQSKESKAKYDGEIMSDKVSDKDMIEAKGFDKYSFRKSK
jgi:hypothetical protein